MRTIKINVDDNDLDRIEELKIIFNEKTVSKAISKLLKYGKV